MAKEDKIRSEYIMRKYLGIEITNCYSASISFPPELQERINKFLPEIKRKLEKLEIEYALKN